MYIDINSVSYDSKKEIVRIEGTDLDNVLLNSWNQEFEEESTITFKFDLTAKGPRIYLYKIIKNLVKEDYKSMKEGLEKLVGKITNISSNFVEKP